SDLTQVVVHDDEVDVAAFGKSGVLLLRDGKPVVRGRVPLRRLEEQVIVPGPRVARAGAPRRVVLALDDGGVERLRPDERILRAVARAPGSDGAGDRKEKRNRDRPGSGH